MAEVVYWYDHTFKEEVAHCSICGRVLIEEMENEN
jgi:hypothetical protein